jgi:molybdopterin synthase catalytic subunit
MMELTIRLFATLKDRVGQDKIQVTVPAPAMVQDVLDAVTAVYPQLAPALATTLVAVNQEFAFPETAVQAGDEIAFFPPVSGGSDAEWPHPTYFALTASELDVNAIHARLSRPDVGAIVSFTGFVRGQTQRPGLPIATRYLEYEAYQAMAEQKMGQIAREIWARWPQVSGIAIVQRLGRLDIGDVTTFVACASGHRDEGCFEAARFGIDRLKEIVPVWKKEVGPDESVWVEGSYRPTPDDKA